MKDTDLNKRLDAYQAPNPSDLLKARILKAAEPQANTSASKPFSKRFMPIAASLVAICAIGFATLQLGTTQKTESAAWQEAAIDLGFDDIYDWVEAEELATQGL